MIHGLTSPLGLAHQLSHLFLFYQYFFNCYKYGRLILTITVFRWSRLDIGYFFYNMNDCKASWLRYIWLMKIWLIKKSLSAIGLWISPTMGLEWSHVGEALELPGVKTFWFHLPLATPHHTPFRIKHQNSDDKSKLDPFSRSWTQALFVPINNVAMFQSVFGVLVCQTCSNISSWTVVFNTSMALPTLIHHLPCPFVFSIASWYSHGSPTGK